MSTLEFFYNGNINLPRAGSKRTYTEHEIKELMRCRDDPVYFAETYFKLVHVDHGLVPFKLYPYQKRAVNIMQHHRRMIMATARQVGKTAVATVIILHYAIFNKNKNIAILANKEATAKEVLERIKLAFEYLPDFLKVGVKEWNKKSIHFENGCKIFADATQGQSVRGKSIALLYIDEVAFVEDWDEFSSAVLPTISSGKTTKLIYTSTPRGLNHFYDAYKLAKEGKSDFELIEVPWWEVEGRDEEWKQKTLADLNYDEEKFAQEQEISFIGSSGTLINGATLKILSADTPIHDSDGLKLYEEPVKGHTYVALVDVSRGKGLDYSTIQVIDVSTTPNKQVMTYRNNRILAFDFASVIDYIGKYYNMAYVLIELNDNGLNVSDALFMYYEYENLISTESKGRAGKQVSAGFGNNVERGITASTTTKSAGCAILKPLIEQGKLLIRDKDTIMELNTFSQKGASYEAEEGKHDDMVMPLVWYAWLTGQAYFKNLTERDMISEMREVSERELAEMMLPMGIVNDGHTDYEDMFDNGAMNSHSGRHIDTSDDILSGMF